MRIRDLVPPEAVLDDIRSDTKEGVLLELSEVLSGMVPSLPAEAIASILLERENLGSTGIGDGVAIPHGKAAGIERLVAAFGRSRKGVQFQSLDGQPAHLFFALMAPETSAGMHLKALARISRLMKDERFRRSLLEARDAGELCRILLEEDGRG
ncbi:MAG: PTS sugar transporter subunit IIA [Deltaproteobacteria bacterium]